MNLIERNTIHCCDCMEGMAQMPDKYIDLAIVDPPYGIGEDGGDKKRNRHYSRIVIHERKDWDVKPSKKYFDELVRVSKNQCIFGANYFVNYLEPHMGWIYWDKCIGGDFSDGELIYTSFDKALRCFKCSHHAGTKGGHARVHPTQKPVALYRWLLQNYAKKGDLILDTHMGSGSSYIACLDMEFDYIGYEIDADYFKAIQDRVYHFTRQQKLFS